MFYRSFRFTFFFFLKKKKLRSFVFSSLFLVFFSSFSMLHEDAFLGATALVRNVGAVVFSMRLPFRGR